MARLALGNSIELKRLEQKLRVSEMAARERWGYFTPSLSLSAVRTLTDQNKPSDVEKKESDYSISISQALYQPNLLSGYREATLYSEMAAIQLRQARENLLQETLTAILDICRLRARLNITEHSLDFMAKTVSIQKKLLNNGYGSKIGLKEAEVELARYRKDYHDLDLQLQLRLLSLSSLTGEVNTSDDFAVTALNLQAVDTAVFSAAQEVWVDAAATHNSQLASVHINRKLNRLSRDRVISQFKPQIDLTLSYEQSENEALVNYRTDESSVALSLSLSFSPVSSYYQVQKQDLDQHALVIEEQKLKRDLENRIGYLLRSIELKQQNIKTQNQWKSIQQTIVEMYWNGLKEKQVPFSQFLDSSRKYNESRIDLIQTAFSIWEDRIQLLHVSGQLTIDTIDELKNALEKRPKQTEDFNE